MFTIFITTLGSDIDYNKKLFKSLGLSKDIEANSVLGYLPILNKILIINMCKLLDLHSTYNIRYLINADFIRKVSSIKPLL